MYKRAVRWAMKIASCRMFFGEAVRLVWEWTGVVCFGGESESESRAALYACQVPGSKRLPSFPESALRCVTPSASTPRALHR